MVRAGVDSTLTPFLPLPLTTEPLIAGVNFKLLALGACSRVVGVHTRPARR